MPYAVVAIVLARLVVWYINRNQVVEAAPTNPYATNWGWLVGAWVALPVLAVVGVMGASAGAVWALILPIGAFVALFPWLTTRVVLIPLARTKAAYWLVSRGSHGVWRYDRFQGGVVAGAWAALRGGSAADLAWLEARLPGPEVSVTPGAALGAGLIAAARGDLAGARLLIAGVELFEPRITAGLALRLAREWLLVDAASLGDWHRVRDLAASPGQRSATIHLLHAIAKRQLHAPDAPPNLSLWTIWALSPCRGGTRPLVQAATGLPMSAPWRPAPGPMPVDPDPLGRALALHAGLLGRARPRRDEVIAVAQAWDVVFDGALDGRIAARAEAVGARQVASARARFADEVQQDLVELARAAGVPLADLPGATVSGAARRIREEVLSELEGLGIALARRVEARRALPPMDELREWLAIRDAWERGAEQAGPEVRRLAFRSVHDPVCSLAVWLFNERGQRALGNALFRWLLGEAALVGDSRSVELQTKNVKCGY